MRNAPCRLFVVLAVTLSACMAHDKSGDRAAAVGDWKAAYTEYRQALADEPNDPKMKEKYERARAEALRASTAAARGCLARRDWGCAVGEADFVLSIEPGNTELSEVRRNAGRELALAEVERARAQVAQGQLRQADATIRNAQRLSNDPKVQQSLSQVSGALVTAAVADADRRRAVRQFPEALAVLQLALPYEPALRDRIEGVKQEQAAFLRAEHDRFMAEGEQLLGRNAWGEAAARFNAAQAAMPDDRARAAEQYARLAMGADAAVERGDWPAATRGYQEMVELRVERNGYAAAQLGRVTVRPWAVRIRSVLVSPLRPDGVPWVGPPRKAVVRIASELARLAGAPPNAPFLMMLNQVPRENQPTVVVEVTAPGAQPLLTAPHRGLYTSLASMVVVGANAFERRRVSFRVLHAEPGGVVEDMGLVEVPIGELVARGRATLQSETVAALELSVEPADGVPLGSFNDLTPVPVAPPPGPGDRQRPPPPPPVRR
jgi:tetratricopeptide (TPR) repeat protein